MWAPRESEPSVESSEPEEGDASAVEDDVPPVRRAPYGAGPQGGLRALPRRHAAGVPHEPRLGEGASKWLVFLEGHGATMKRSCQERARTPLGSSNRMSHNFRFDGILSNSSLLNPFFYNWNAVYVRYCDGASFSGKVASTQAPFRQGHMVFGRIVHDLWRGE